MRRPSPRPGIRHRPAFADLVSFLAYRTGRPAWRSAWALATIPADLANSWATRSRRQYSLEAYVRTPPGKPDEDRAAVKRSRCGTSTATRTGPYCWIPLKLRECPPLREVPGLKRGWYWSVGSPDGFSGPAISCRPP